MTTLHVLIVDNCDDPHGEAILKELATLGFRVARYNLTDLRRCHIQVEPGVLRLGIDTDRYRITSDTTVWWRRRGAVDVTDLDDEEARLALDEGPHILLGALRSVGVRWVDDPNTVNRADLKLFQLGVAQELGVKIPKSIVTNDLDSARKLAGPSGSIVAKALSPGVGIAPFTSEVEEDELECVVALPTLLQERIIATVDLRVVVIGDRGWLWRRPRSGSTIDWRAEDPDGLGFHVADDQEVLDNARRITSALGLTMSVQDWLETDNGAVFLESNAQGNWLFLERAREIIVPALARFLASQSDPKSGFWSSFRKHIRTCSRRMRALWTVNDKNSANNGYWPPLWKRVLYDLLPARWAPAQDGAKAPNIEPPKWSFEDSVKPYAIEVVRRVHDEAKSSVLIAEKKASRLQRTALSVLAIAFALGGFQLRIVADEGWSWWLFTLVPVVLAIVFIAVSALEAHQVDRVGFYQYPKGEDLAAFREDDPVTRIASEEDVGRKYAAWTSNKKHSDVMQARAWFTRGLIALILAAVLSLGTWWYIHQRDVETKTGQCMGTAHTTLVVPYAPHERDLCLAT